MLFVYYLWWLQYIWRGSGSPHEKLILVANNTKVKKTVQFGIIQIISGVQKMPPERENIDYEGNGQILV